MGEDTVKNFVFEEEYIDISTGLIGIDQDLIPNLIQDTKDHNSIEKPSYMKLFPKKKPFHFKNYAIKEIH